MLIFITRYLPAVIATGHLSMVAAITHFDFICKLYDKYLISDKASTHLVTLCEDRLRHEWAKKCGNDGFVDFETDAGNLNKHVFNSCKIKLEAVLKSAGLNVKSGTADSQPEFFSEMPTMLRPLH